LLDLGIDSLQFGKDRFQWSLFSESEIKVLGETVIPEIAPLQRCSTLEYKTFAERRAGKAHKKPGKAVITFEDRRGNSAAAFAGKPVGKKRNVGLSEFLKGFSLKNY